MLIRNRDWPNWQNTMHVGAEPPPDATGARRAPFTRPRPGHADLVGRAQVRPRRHARHPRARERARNDRARGRRRPRASTARTRSTSRCVSHVSALGALRLPDPLAVTFDEVAALPADSPLRCVDPAVEARMVAEIDRAREAGDTLRRRVRGHRARRAHRPRQPRPVGSQARWPPRAGDDVDPGDQGGGNRHGTGAWPTCRARKCTTKSCCRNRAHRARDLGVVRPTNHAGGLEGGITNGEDLRVSGYMKPISTLMKPLRSVDLATMAGIAGGHRAQRRLRHYRPPASSAKRWCRSCSPTRSSRSSAAIRWPRSIATTPPPARTSGRASAHRRDVVIARPHAVAGARR